MDRARVSTTVDATSLARARELMAVPDSRLLDEALRALLEQLEGERELRALALHPYEKDPDLSWSAPPGPDLPYDGPVPNNVTRVTPSRRRR